MNNQDLIDNIEHVYDESLKVLDDFGGPSIYFHIKCIEEQESNFLSERHIELIYAVLTSWGMHRMGNPEKTKTKLHDYVTFNESIMKHSKKLNELRDYKYESIKMQEYIEMLNSLRKVYDDLRISISSATIVGNAKTLAHILPNIIPPIDRQYTLLFFQKNKDEFLTVKRKLRTGLVPPSRKKQEDLFIDTCRQIKEMFDRIDWKNVFSIDKQTFNTSYPKIMDNVIMEYVKSTTSSNSE